VNRQSPGVGEGELARDDDRLARAALTDAIRVWVSAPGITDPRTFRVPQTIPANDLALLAAKRFELPPGAYSLQDERIPVSPKASLAQNGITDGGRLVLTGPTPHNLDTDGRPRP
jgi:hypothetical protein